MKAWGWGNSLREREGGGHQPVRFMASAHIPLTPTLFTSIPGAKHTAQARAHLQTHSSEDSHDRFNPIRLTVLVNALTAGFRGDQLHKNKTKQTHKSPVGSCRVLYRTPQGRCWAEVQQLTGTGIQIHTHIREQDTETERVTHTERETQTH